MYTNNENQIPNEDQIENEYKSNSSLHQSDIVPTSRGVKKKRNKKGPSVGIVALALSLALIGGAIGGASTGYFLGQKNASISSSTNFATGNSTQYATSIANTTTKSINSVYETYKSAVVGVKNEGTTTNVFGQTSAAASSGTGFIISADGYILTNNHVVENADKVTVTLYNEENYTATVIGADAQNDVALLKINATDLNKVELRIPAYPDGCSGNIRTANRKHPDTLSSNLIVR